MNTFCPPNSSGDLCLFFCLYPYGRQVERRYSGRYCPVPHISQAVSFLSNAAYLGDKGHVQLASYGPTLNMTQDRVLYTHHKIVQQHVLTFKNGGTQYYLVQSLTTRNTNKWSKILLHTFLKYVHGRLLYSVYCCCEAAKIPRTDRYRVDNGQIKRPKTQIKLVKVDIKCKLQSKNGIHVDE